MLPTAISRLAAPPAGFEPCEIPKYLGANFKDHLTFSRVRNKTYWILFSGPNQGVYSLKVTCLAAKEAADNEEDVIGALETWEEVLRAWAAHCFHRHGKCAIHTQACVSGRCAAHAPSARAGTSTTIKVVRVKREAIVKIEPGVKLEAGVKQENTLATPPRPATAPRPKRTVERAAPPSYTPIPETDSDSDGLPAGSAPLFDPDSPESAPPARLPSYDPDAPVHNPSALTPSRLSRSPSRAATPARISRSYSTGPGPSRSQSGALGASSVARGVSSISRVSRVRGVAGGGQGSTSTASVDDAFYVDARGAIHHSSADAFKQVGAGPVQVVLGWEAATKYARELVEEAEVEVEDGKGNGKGKGKAKNARKGQTAPHETVDWLQWKLLKQRGKKKTKKRAKALLRLRELRARDDAGSTHESDGGDTSRTTEDLIDEADWREAVGKEWRFYVGL
ncbi:hypothetical protein DFH06DRAFT_1325355 [Mycena polygramma]|nr:hypothetical protein DFH06DRAFT_1325355 [Mycena polygramma]